MMKECVSGWLVPVSYTDWCVWNWRCPFCLSGWSSVDENKARWKRVRGGKERKQMRWFDVKLRERGEWERKGTLMGRQTCQRQNQRLKKRGLVLGCHKFIHTQAVYSFIHVNLGTPTVVSFSPYLDFRQLGHVFKFHLIF